MKKLILSLSILLLAINMQAQEGVFTASVNIDSVLLGNYIEVSFTLKNVQGKNFESPSFEGFQIVAGPNQSSSFQMINGNVSQEISYSYHLLAEDIGTYFIPPVSIETDEGFLETLPLEINVYPNPDGIQQNSKSPRSDYHFFDFPRMNPNPPATLEKPKKKRKIYRM